MITYIEEDITNNSEGLVVHGVNCRGAFSAGVAGAIRRVWPAVYKRYAEMPVGWQMLGRFDPVHLTENLYVANCYTQLDYGPPMAGKKYASPNAITKSLRLAAEFAQEHNLVLKSPKIGSGLGGLDWETEVKPIFEMLNNDYNIDIEIFQI